MIRHKREVLSAVLTGKEATKRINRIITIERQEKNKGSDGAGQSIVSLKRTKPLRLEKANRYDSAGSDVVEFSEDYFRKVPPRRRDWARSLGLWNDQYGLTQRGKGFIDGLKESGYIDAEGVFTYWPMDFELVRAGFRPDLLGEDTKSLWNCLTDFGSAYAGVHLRPRSEADAINAVTLIGKMMEIFRTLHVRKAMLRREMPITAAYPAVVACACAVQEAILDLPAAIEAEQKGKERRLVFRQSRNTGGALSLKR